MTEYPLFTGKAGPDLTVYMSNTQGILFEAETAYPSRTPALIPSFSMGSVILIVLIFVLSYYLSLRF
jgi:hypothetical protein